MIKHKKIYLSHFGYGMDDKVLCEACLCEAVDVHHIFGKNIQDADNINNLMALCRKHHSLAHSDKTYVTKSDFQYIHNCFMQGKRKIHLR